MSERSRLERFAPAALAVLVLATLLALFTRPSADAGAAGVRANPSDVYNPVTAGEALPDGFRQLLPRDAIRPVYEPEFTSAAEIGWPANTDVIGVVQGDEAKAYPVAFLGGRELVVDEIDGIPILVSW